MRHRVLTPCRRRNARPRCARHQRESLRLPEPGRCQQLRRQRDEVSTRCRRLGSLPRRKNRRSLTRDESHWGTEGREFKSRQPDKQIPCLSRRFAAAGVSKRTAIPGFQPYWVAVGRKGWGPHHGPPCDLDQYSARDLGTPDCDFERLRG